MRASNIAQLKFVTPLQVRNTSTQATTVPKAALTQICSPWVGSPPVTVPQSAECRSIDPIGCTQLI